MKKFLIVLLCAFLLFPLVSCDNDVVEKVEPEVSPITSTVVISGKQGTALSKSVEINITLSKGSFKAISSGDVSSWFEDTKRIAGLTYTVSAVEDKAKSLVITIGGTPSVSTNGLTDIGKITIGKDNFTYATNDLVINLPQGSGYNIEEPKVEPEVSPITSTVVISGKQGTALSKSVEINITLSKGSFKAISSGDVSSWFEDTKRIAGLTYTVSAVEDKAKSLVITIGGTPSVRTNGLTDIGKITIGKDNFTYATNDLVVNLPQGSGYNIEEPKVEPEVSPITSTIVISGYKGQPILPVSINVELAKGFFNQMTANTEITETWFSTSKVAGLSYKIKDDVLPSSKSLTIVISGTPTAISNDPISFTIPQSAFEYATSDKNVSLEYGNYSIVEKIESKGDVRLITVNGEANGKTNYENNTLTVDLGQEAGDLYLVISNPTTASVKTPTISGFTQTTTKMPYSTKTKSIKSVGSVDEETYGFKDKLYEVPLLTKVINVGTRTKEFTDVTNNFVSPYKDMKVGDSKTLYRTNAAEAMVGVKATLREKRTVTTSYGDKTLFIFVEDAMWNTPLKDAVLQTSATIDAAFIKTQADTFLKDGLNNDIYDYVSSIYGEEWGWDSNMSVDYISKTNEIVIFFAQIEGQTSGRGATAGYYTNGHNMQNGESSTTSNEAICLTMDAYYNAYNPESSLTTMAHEFQHAIHYYQRVAKKGSKLYQVTLPSGSTYVKDNESVASDTWVNEMFAALSEDAIAKFIGVSGPGYNDADTGFATIDDDKNYFSYNGRLPQYFQAQRYTLTDWSGTSEVDSLYPYGLVYSFGSYLVRNYGSDFIKKYMESSLKEYPDAKVVYDSSKNALYYDIGESNAHNIVLEAIKESTGLSTLTWSDLIRGWGASVLLSDRIDAEKPYQLTLINDSGDFWWTEPYSKYSLKIPSLYYFVYVSTSGQMWDTGSNLITIGPYIFNEYTDRLFSKVNSTLRANTNTFLALDKNVSGTKTYTISGDSNLKYTLVFKPIDEE